MSNLKQSRLLLITARAAGEEDRDLRRERREFQVFNPAEDGLKMRGLVGF